MLILTLISSYLSIVCINFQMDFCTVFTLKIPSIPCFYICFSFIICFTKSEIQNFIIPRIKLYSLVTQAYKLLIYELYNLYKVSQASDKQVIWRITAIFWQVVWGSKEYCFFNINVSCYSIFTRLQMFYLDTKFESMGKIS